MTGIAPSVAAALRTKSRLFNICHLPSDQRSRVAGSVMTRYHRNAIFRTRCLAAQWSQVTDRRGDLVPAYGFLQAEREVESAARGAR